MSHDSSCVAFPVQPAECATCAEFMTDCGTPQPNMMVAFPCGHGIPICGTPTQLITIEEYRCSPSVCYKTGCDAQIEQIIGLVGEMINDFYGERIDPCYGTRCFPLNRCSIEIDSAIRIDRVERSRCGCSPCDVEWEDVEPCRVSLHSREGSGMPPYDRLTLCDCCSCGGGSVRVTGVWGMFWPIPPSIRGAITTLSSKLFKAATEGRAVISNLNDGTTTVTGATFSASEIIGLLPRGPVRYRGVRV